jgi:adenosylcobinamide-GDP ribazoletransferase
VAAGALSRLVPVLLAAALPYARASEGAGVALTRGGPVGAVLATVVASAFAVGLAGADGAAMVGFTAALTVVLWLACRRWLGGVTGDALGAALEVTETGGLVLAVALVGGHA